MNRLRRIWQTFWLAFATIAAIACASAPVVMPPDYNPEAWEMVEELRIPAHQAQLQREGFGQVVVTTEELPDRQLGEAYLAGKNPCRPRIRLDPQAPTTVLAHELGHTLLLQHAPNAPHSFTHPRTDGETQTEIVPEQEYFMQAGAQLLRACRRAYDRKARKRKDE